VPQLGFLAQGTPLPPRPTSPILIGAIAVAAAAGLCLGASVAHRIFLWRWRQRQQQPAAKQLLASRTANVADVVMLSRHCDPRASTEWVLLGVA